MKHSRSSHLGYLNLRSCVTIVTGKHWQHERDEVEVEEKEDGER